jgi:hypothetical protein
MSRKTLTHVIVLVLALLALGLLPGAAFAGDVTWPIGLIVAVPALA